MNDNLERIIKFTKRIKQGVSLAVLLLMAVIVASSVIELSIVLFNEIFDAKDDSLCG